MRMLRSLVCAGLAIAAMALCASMPAAAAVPIDAHVIVQPMTGSDQPAFPAVAIVYHDASVLPAEAPIIASRAHVRSPLGSHAHMIAASSFPSPAYDHIDPGRAG